LPKVGLPRGSFKIEFREFCSGFEIGSIIKEGRSVLTVEMETFEPGYWRKRGKCRIGILQ
jgi:hypothetical protein